MKRMQKVQSDLPQPLRKLQIGEDSDFLDFVSPPGDDRRKDILRVLIGHLVRSVGATLECVV